MLSGHAGSDDINAVEALLFHDLFDLALPGEIAIGHLDVEVLGHLLAVQHRTNRDADLGGAAQRSRGIAARPGTISPVRSTCNGLRRAFCTLDRRLLDPPVIPHGGFFPDSSPSNRSADRLSCIRAAPMAPNVSARICEKFELVRWRVSCKPGAKTGNAVDRGGLASIGALACERIYR
jgi:hypothetical protein